MKKRAFTLIEILLVTLIIGILTGILFKTYITVSQISFRIEQQKHLNQELLFVSETLQNLANRNEINYEKYLDLNLSKGFTNTLYLNGEDGDISIYSVGNCSQNLPSPDCSLAIEKDGKISTLINADIQMSQTIFKIIPYANNQSYFENGNLCDTNYLSCINAQGFRFFTKLYAKGYNQENRTTNVTLFVQQFFNI